MKTLTFPHMVSNQQYFGAGTNNPEKILFSANTNRLASHVITR